MNTFLVARHLFFVREEGIWLFYIYNVYEQPILPTDCCENIFKINLINSFLAAWHLTETAGS